MISSALHRLGWLDTSARLFMDRRSIHGLICGGNKRRPAVMAGLRTATLRPPIAYFILIYVFVLSACANSRTAQSADRDLHQPTVDKCPPAKIANQSADSASPAEALIHRPPRKYWLPMSAYDDPRERTAEQTPGRSQGRPRIPPRIPNMSYQETDATLAEIARNLRDGNIKPACEHIYYFYYSNNDSFYIGDTPHTDAQLRKMRIYQDRLHAILGPCLPFLIDWFQSFAMIQLMIKKNPRDPVLRQSYALILEASDDDKLLHVAEVLLEELAASRAMTRAEGYAALARIRMRLDHSLEYAQEMVKRCQAMTKRRQVCPSQAELETLQRVERIDNL